MKVGNRLPGLFAAIYHQPVSARGKPETEGRLHGTVHDFRPHFGLSDMGR
jgi:hypothetical protein